MINSKNIEAFLIKALTKIDEDQNEKFTSKWDLYSEGEQQALVTKAKADYLARRERNNVESIKEPVYSSEAEHSNVVTMARSEVLTLNTVESEWKWSDLHGAAAHSGETKSIVDNLFRLTPELLNSQVKGFRLEFKGEGTASLKVKVNVDRDNDPKIIPYRASIGGKYKEIHNLEFNDENNRIKVFSLKEPVKKEQFKIGYFFLNVGSKL